MEVPWLPMEVVCHPEGKGVYITSEIYRKWVPPQGGNYHNCSNLGLNSKERLQLNQYVSDKLRGTEDIEIFRGKVPDSSSSEGSFRTS